MIINTKRFGPIKIDENQVITFISPILGFGELQKYVFIQSEEEQHPFEFLQSIEDENLTFIVTDPFTFFKEYEFQLDSHWVEALEVYSEGEVQIMAIVTARSAEDITCNLKAPIVLNRTRNIAAQIVIEDGNYTTRQPLLGGKKGEDSGADLIQK
ncbi:flagellar assembly protein FliW [Paenibacillus ihbetae]|uniref:Flagellar assembly factor FliW n=1 Tax=Paenibacillus ihbetae TaxID=1870820 RepID=A0ABX3K2U2_9BACL|nr:flagellar assembly protein FliW [Paenibacillus ihbetae]OOC63755.1 flagellar assembly protein FliW [Paenibacillus ihbetae]